MTFKDYKELAERAKAAGIKSNPALTQLLHLLQAKDAAQRHYKAYLRDMNDWEKNCASWVERAIREADEENEI